MSGDICHFCGSDNACYQQRDHGVWVDSCFECAKPKPGAAAKKTPKEDFTFLDDPLDPVAPVNEQNGIFQNTLFRLIQ
jgi:hypothetical protein